MSPIPGTVERLILQNQVGSAESSLKLSVFRINTPWFVCPPILRERASEEHDHPLTSDEKLVLVIVCWHLLLWSYLAFCWQAMLFVTSLPWPPSSFGSATFSQLFCSPLDGSETPSVLPPTTYRAPPTRPLSGPHSETPSSALANSPLSCLAGNSLSACACLQIHQEHWKEKHRPLLWDLPQII